MNEYLKMLQEQKMKSMTKVVEKEVVTAPKKKGRKSKKDDQRKRNTRKEVYR